MTEDEFDTIAKNTFDNEFTQELIERIRTRKKHPACFNSKSTRIYRNVV